jgi:hypothetical protein
MLAVVPVCSLQVRIDQQGKPVVESAQRSEWSRGSDMLSDDGGRSLSDVLNSSQHEDTASDAVQKPREVLFVKRRHFPLTALPLTTPADALPEDAECIASVRMYGTNSFASKTDDTSWRVRNAPELLSRMARQAITSLPHRHSLCEHPRAQLTYPKAHGACDFCGQVLHKRLKFLHCDTCALAACSTCCGAQDDPADILAEEIDYLQKSRGSHEACTHSSALLTSTPYASGGVRCDVCGQTMTTYPGGALYLHCEGCQFDVCTTCRSHLY